MQITAYLTQLTGLSAEQLFSPGSALVRISETAGVFSVDFWNVPGVTQPTPDQLLAAWEEPDVVAVPAAVPRRQFFQAAAQEAIITDAEALAFLASGVTPANLLVAINSLPPTQQFTAQMAILGDQNFYRADPLVALPRRCDGANAGADRRPVHSGREPVMKFLRFLVALLGLATAPAFAQSYPSWMGQYNYVATPAQWVAAMQAKQDVLNYTPCNQAGCAMTGKLWVTPSLAAAAGFNLSPGVAPTSPINGDMWMTTTGLYARVNGTTIGPFVASFTLSGDVTNAGSVITLNTVNGSPGTIGGSGLVPSFTVNGKGLVTATTTVTDMVGYRNRIINGNDLLDQRNGFGSQAITAGAALAYTDDRFYVYSTGGNPTGQVVNRGVAALKEYQITGAASTTGIWRCQRIESYNSADLASGNATFAVDISNSYLGSVGWQIWYANTQDAFGTVASPTVTSISSGSFTVSSSLTRYSATVAIPSGATTGLQVCLSVGAQTTGTWVTSNWQLEPGSTATAYERRSLQVEYNLAARYYVQPALTNIMSYGAYGIASNAAIAGEVLLPVPMRGIPTAVFLGTPSLTNCSALTVSGVFIQGFYIYATATASNPISITGYWSASAEL